MRRRRSVNTVSSSFGAALNAGLYGWVSVIAPFFAELEKRSDRGRARLIGKAWDLADPNRESLFKDLVEGRIRHVWLTPAQAASSRWTRLADHKAFAKAWLDVLKVEARAVKAAMDGTEIAQAVLEPQAKNLKKNRDEQA